MPWKWLLAIILVGTVVSFAMQPNTDTCRQLYYSTSSGSAYKCAAGLNSLRLTSSHHTDATITTDVPATVWITTDGTDAKTAERSTPDHIGPHMLIRLAGGNALIYLRTSAPVTITTSFAQ